MPHKFRNIRAILFATYTLIIVIVFTVLVIWFYLWASDLMKSNAVEAVYGMGQSMQDHIDSELQKMNDVSLNVMYSNLVKDRFRHYLEGERPDEPIGSQYGGTGGNAVQNAKELADILTAAIGPSRPVEQLYLYDLKSKVYGNGFDNGERTYRPAEQAWYEPVLRNTTGKYINLPRPDDEMTRFISARDKQYSISLFRLIYDSYNEPMGIIEVKQYFSRIFKSVLEYKEQSPFHEQVLVYNDDGAVIYPLGASAAAYRTYIDFGIRERNAGRTSASFTNPETGEKELLSLHRSPFSGWNTVLIVSQDRLLHPLATFAKQTVPVAFVILLFAIVLSYLAARRITLPILKIHRAIRGTTLEDLGSGLTAAREFRSGLNELDQLHLSFVHMSARLKQSMDELLLSQSQELQARMLALQSQMNPHFLYNTLATIHVMAEENMNGQIIAMTENMSDFLRYFSSDESLVALEKELLHTRKYLEINRIRFGRKLEAAFEVDERLLELRIPKLVIQPLVENALKYGTLQEPPWRIRVRGYLAEDGWRIEVSDNGGGFASDSLALLRKRIREVDETGVIPVLKLDGMGLLNIYIRMKVTYGAEAVFDIRRNGPNGAAVVIGGILRKGEADDDGYKLAGGA